MEPLNILALTSWYPHEGDPYLGNFVQRHCEAIATKHRVYVIYIAEVSNATEEKIDKREKGNLTEIIAYAHLSKNRVFKYAQKRKLVFKCISELNVKFDLLHAHVAFQMAPIFSSVSKKLLIPWVFTEHWNGYHEEFRPKINPLKWNWVMNSASSAKMAFPVSENLSISMRKVFPKLKLLCVANVVEDVFFQKRAPHHPNGKTRFLHVSNLLEPYKNIHRTLKGFAQLKERGFDFELLIISDGDASGAKKWVKELGLHDNVKFQGASSPAQIAEEMHRSDALILFSNTENQPCVVLESISTGLPVVASNVGDIPNLVTTDRGFTSPPQNVDEFAQNLAKFTETKSSFERQSVSANTHEQFSKEAVAEKYTSAYVEILSNR